MVGPGAWGVNLDFAGYARIACRRPAKPAATDWNSKVYQILRLPNAITVARLALAPVMVVLLKEQEYRVALAVFVLAGVSDALDGFIAKHYNQTTRLGAILDPVADKTLLVSVYVMMTVIDAIPFWLMVAVAFRDLLIIGGYVVYTSLVGAVQMRPSALSKLNTLMQIVLALAVLVQLSGLFPVAAWIAPLIYVVLFTTVASGVHYLWAWGVMKDVERAGPGGAGE